MQDVHCNASTSKAWIPHKCCFCPKPCIDFKKFIEKSTAHREAVYHKEGTAAAKRFVESMETGQYVYASLNTGYGMQVRENRNILTSIVKTVMFCASNHIALREHSQDKGHFMKLL